MMQTKRWMLAAALAVGGLGMAGAATAECRGPGGPGGPGGAAMMQELFVQADADGNGALSLEEFRTLHSLREEAIFTRLDTDGDGLVSADELAAGRPRRGRRSKE
jgi:EF-hand domain pair